MDKKDEYKIKVKQIEQAINIGSKDIYDDVEQLHRLIASDSKDVEANVELGKLQYQRGYYADSYNTFSNIVEISGEKEEICLNYLLKSSIMVGYYDDALYYLASLESILDSSKKIFDFAIIHALLCYLNSVETKDPVCDYYYMTEEITNPELLEIFRKMLDCIIAFDFAKAIELCNECDLIARNNKIDLEFSTLSKLLHASEDKKQKNENKEYEIESNPTLAKTTPKLADNK